MPLFGLLSTCFLLSAFTTNTHAHGNERSTRRRKGAKARRVSGLDLALKPLAADWDDWEYCDGMDNWRRFCDPIEPVCHMETDGRQARKGFGNALPRSSQAAASVFKRNCSVSFDRTKGDTFQLADHCVYPQPLIPGCVANKKRNALCQDIGPCVLFALTQPGPRVQATLNASRGSEKLPTVALHFRTGWADAMAGMEAPKWKDLDCSNYQHDEAYRGATAFITAFETEAGRFRLPKILSAVRKAANKAFGKQSWQLFTSSDSPAVKQFPAKYFQHRVRRTFFIEGKTGHNNVRLARRPDLDVQFALDIGASAVADLIALSEADMLVHFQSKFPSAAAQRTPCHQRRVELKSSSRDHDTRSRVISVSHALRAEAPNFKSLPNYKSLVPKKHTCLKASKKDPFACFCYYKLGMQGRWGQREGKEGADRAVEENKIPGVDVAAPQKSKDEL